MPSTPAIAPLAPISGSAVAAGEQALHQPGEGARQQVEDAEQRRAEAILDRAAEDPQEHHVAAQVHRTRRG